MKNSTLLNLGAIHSTEYSHISMVYDVCFLLLQSVAHDARTLNLARTLVKNGKTVLLLGTGTPSDSLLLSREGLKFIPILPPQSHTKLSIRWTKFHLSIIRNKYKFQARIYCAEDVFTLPTAFKLSATHTARVVYDAREIFSALASNHSRPLRQKFISAMEKYYAPKLSSIFTSGDLDSDYLATYLSVRRPEVVMNVPPYANPINSNILREKYHIATGTKILLYQGWLAEGRGILDAVLALQFMPDVVFCLLGDGEFQSVIRETARSAGVESRVIFCGKVPYDQLPLWTASADAGLCYIEPISLSYSYALPNKLFEYCMAGIPSIISDLPAMRKVVEQYPVGKIIAPKATSQELADTILSLFDDRFQRTFKEIQGIASRFYCWENQEETVLSIFRVTT